MAVTSNSCTRHMAIIKCICEFYFQAPEKQNPFVSCVSLCISLSPRKIRTLTAYIYNTLNVCLRLISTNPLASIQRAIKFQTGPLTWSPAIAAGCDLLITDRTKTPKNFMILTRVKNTPDHLQYVMTGLLPIRCRNMVLTI